MFKVFEILDPNTGGDPETSNPREGESAEDTATLIGVAGFNLNVEYIGVRCFEYHNMLLRNMMTWRSISCSTHNRCKKK